MKSSGGSNIHPICVMEEPEIPFIEGRLQKNAHDAF
jgi:hypothetical protein